MSKEVHRAASSPVNGGGASIYTADGLYPYGGDNSPYGNVRLGMGSREQSAKSIGGAGGAN